MCCMAGRDFLSFLFLIQSILIPDAVEQEAEAVLMWCNAGTRSS